MCGRFTLRSPHSWVEEFFSGGLRDRLLGLQSLAGYTPRFNVAPTQPVLVLLQDPQGEFTLAPMHWGLVPAWATSSQNAYSMINARVESVLEKNSFKSLVPNSRCVVLADGYYEWMSPNPKTKLPYWIHRPDQKPFGMAGLWTTNLKVNEGESLASATVITTAANADTQIVHERMPAMLYDSESVLKWLDRDTKDLESLIDWVAKPLVNQLTCWPVSKKVGNVRNEGEELIQPVEREVAPQQLTFGDWLEG